MKYTETTTEILEDDGFFSREKVHVIMKLKSCPFCGARPQILHVTDPEDDTNEDLIQVKCPECGGTVNPSPEHEAVAQAWNRRA